MSTLCPHRKKSVDNPLCNLHNSGFTTTEYYSNNPILNASSNILVNGHLVLNRPFPLNSHCTLLKLRSFEKK